MHVKIRFEFLNIKHVKHESIKFTLTLSQNLKMTLIQKIPPTMHALHENDCQLPNFCVQRHVQKGVGLYSRHNLHHTDHIQNGKQRIGELFKSYNDKRQLRSLFFAFDSPFPLISEHTSFESKNNNDTSTIKSRHQIDLFYSSTSKTSFSIQQMR